VKILIDDIYAYDLSDEFHRLWKINPFKLLNERKDVPARVTSEAMIDLFVGRHGKRRSLFFMKRTQTDIVRPALLERRNIPRNDFLDPRARANKFYGFLGN